MINFLGIVTGGVASILGTALEVSAAVVEEIFMGLLRRLPDAGGFPADVHTAAIYFGNALGKVSFIFPVDTMIYCLVIVISFKMMLFGFHMVKVMMNWVRGIATERNRERFL